MQPATGAAGIIVLLEQGGSEVRPSRQLGGSGGGSGLCGIACLVFAVRIADPRCELQVKQQAAWLQHRATACEVAGEHRRAAAGEAKHVAVETVCPALHVLVGGAGCCMRICC